LSLGEKLVAVFDNLVSSADEIHVMLLQESRDYIGSESEGNTTIVLAPSSDILIGVRPKEIAEKTTIRNLNWLARVQAARGREQAKLYSG